MDPLVSILIPAYNAERWISSTIESALSQTWARTEIIVVDDGSSDRTQAIARSFSGRGVLVFHQQNQGAAAARNHAFSKCRGDYIQWLDADDLLAPDKISLQFRRLEEVDGDRSVLLSSSWGRFIHRPYRAAFYPTSLWTDLSPVEWMLRYLQDKAWMQTCTWLVSRQLTEAAGPWDTRLLGDDDGEYFCRVILASSEVRFARRSRVYYRRSPNSLSYVGRSHRKLEAQLLSMQLQFAHLLAVEDSHRTRAACIDYLQHFMIYFYPDMPDLAERAQTHAQSLGGTLQIPKPSLKYRWIQRTFGWSFTKRLQCHYNSQKAYLIRGIDYLLFRIGI